MKEDYFPLIALIFVIPIIISPITIEAVQIDDGEANGIVQFESPKNFTSIKNAIDTDFFPTLNSTLQNFITNEISGFTASLNEDIILNEQGINQTSGLMIYEFNAEVVFSGTTTGNIGQYITKLITFIADVKNDVVTFLISQNATQATSYIDYPTGEVITREI